MQRSGTWLCLVPPLMVPMLRIGPPGKQGVRFVRKGRLQRPQPCQDGLHRLDRVHAEVLVGGVCLSAPSGDLQVGRAAVGDSNRVARRLAIDGCVTDEPRGAQRPGTDPTLEMAGDTLEHDVAARPVATARDAPQRRGRCCRAGLHVGYAGAVDLAVLQRSSERIPGPVLAELVDVEMAVEHQRSTPTTALAVALRPTVDPVSTRPVRPARIPMW